MKTREEMYKIFVDGTNEEFYELLDSLRERPEVELAVNDLKNRVEGLEKLTDKIIKATNTEESISTGSVLKSINKLDPK